MLLVGGLVGGSLLRVRVGVRPVLVRVRGYRLRSSHGTGRQGVSHILIVTWGLHFGRGSLTADSYVLILFIMVWVCMLAIAMGLLRVVMRIRFIRSLLRRAEIRLERWLRESGNAP